MATRRTGPDTIEVDNRAYAHLGSPMGGETLYLWASDGNVGERALVASARQNPDGSVEIVFRGALDQDLRGRIEVTS